MRSYPPEDNAIRALRLRGREIGYFLAQDFYWHNPSKLRAQLNRSTNARCARRIQSTLSDGLARPGGPRQMSPMSSRITAQGYGNCWKIRRSSTGLKRCHRDMT